MTYIVAFEEEFVGAIRTVYYVNEDNQKTSRGSIATSYVCPKCEERHIYKLFEERAYHEKDGLGIETYSCKCASCRKPFDLYIEHELEE